MNQCEVVDDLQKICNHVSKHDTCSDEFQEHAFSRIIHSLERKVEEVNNMIKRVPEMRDIVQRIHPVFKLDVSSTDNIRPREQ